jgi:hypothetical protein
LVPKPRQAVAFFGHDGNRHWRDETLAVISIVALFTIWSRFHQRAGWATFLIASQTEGARGFTSSADASGDTNSSPAGLAAELPLQSGSFSRLSAANVPPKREKKHHE